MEPTSPLPTNWGFTLKNTSSTRDHSRTGTGPKEEENFPPVVPSKNTGLKKKVERTPNVKWKTPWLLPRPVEIRMDVESFKRGRGQVMDHHSRSSLVGSVQVSWKKLYGLSQITRNTYKRFKGCVTCLPNALHKRTRTHIRGVGTWSRSKQDNRVCGCTSILLLESRSHTRNLRLGELYLKTKSMDGLSRRTVQEIRKEISQEWDISPLILSSVGFLNNTSNLLYLV